MTRTVLAWQPYGVEGLLLADLDLTAATGLYAHRYKPQASNSQRLVRLASAVALP